MSILDLRRYSRASLAIGSTCIIAGGVLMFLHHIDVGDGLMIFGLALLIIGAVVLARTPTGDKDGM